MCTILAWMLSVLDLTLGRFALRLTPFLGRRRSVDDSDMSAMMLHHCCGCSPFVVARCGSLWAN